MHVKSPGSHPHHLTSFTGEARDQYQQVENSDGNQAELSHELLAGGASFMAMKMFEDRQRKEGEQLPTEAYLYYSLLT